MREADEAGVVALPAVEINLRALVPSGRIRRDRWRFAAILILCLVVHLIALVPLPFAGKDIPALEEAIPIEILVEPPPEQEPEKQPEEQAKEVEEPPAPVQQTLDEKAATDAARSAESEAKAQEQKQEQKQSQPQEPPQEQKQDAPQSAELAPEEPVYADVPLPPRIPQARQGLSSLEMEPLPDFRFEAPARRMPFPGGNAEPTYLSMLYGMIMQHMFTPQMDAPKEILRGRISFGIGRDGRIFQEAIVKSSGMRELDRAALTAVRRAGPFPLPPGGGPIYLTFDYQSK